MVPVPRTWKLAGEVIPPGLKHHKTRECWIPDNKELGHMVVCVPSNQTPRGEVAKKVFMED